MSDQYHQGHESVTEMSPRESVREQQAKVDELQADLDAYDANWKEYSKTGKNETELFYAEAGYHQFRPPLAEDLANAKANLAIATSTVRNALEENDEEGSLSSTAPDVDSNNEAQGKLPSLGTAPSEESRGNGDVKNEYDHKADHEDSDGSSDGEWSFVSKRFSGSCQKR